MNQFNTLQVAPASTHVKMIWDQAVEYCKNLNVDGYSDWYLPSVDEIKTIQEADMNTVYWTSSEAPWVSNLSALYFCFSNGNALRADDFMKSGELFVRAVRKVV